jgi:hypothetical protein
MAYTASILEIRTQQQITNNVIRNTIITINDVCGNIIMINAAGDNVSQ